MDPDRRADLAAAGARRGRDREPVAVPAEPHPDPVGRQQPAVLGQRDALPGADELAGDEDAITSSTYIPVEYAVEIRDEQGRPIEQEVFHYGPGNVSVQFPDLTDEQILRRGGRPFTVLDSAENRWRVIAMVNSGPDKGACTWPCR
ncbi:hypothetical protein [Brachybacterium sp. GPGPB12]|uniref:hypothetical protein n=1 Tax=Brachybacterium sp. GPGPB12 TaxID=3023517 RepID=UPI0031343424